MARRAKGNGFSMRSGKRTSFKNMGSTSLSRTGYSNKPDGRAKSSAFQLTEEEEIKKLAEERAKKNLKEESETTVTTERGERDGVKGMFEHTDKTTKRSGAGSAEFNRAFARAKDAGLSTFTFEGKEYNTDIAESSTSRTSKFRPDEEALTIEPKKPNLPPTETTMKPEPGRIKTCMDKPGMAKKAAKCVDTEKFKRTWDSSKCFCDTERTSKGKSTRRQKAIKDAFSKLNIFKKRYRNQCSGGNRNSRECTMLSKLITDMN